MSQRCCGFFWVCRKRRELCGPVYAESIVPHPAENLGGMGLPHSWWRKTAPAAAQILQA